MSRRDRRGFERAPREPQPPPVAAPKPLPVAPSLAPLESVESADVAPPGEPLRALDDVAPDVASTDVSEPPAAPPERPATFVARVEIRHNRVRYAVGAEIPSAVVAEMIACGLRVGDQIAEG